MCVCVCVHNEYWCSISNPDASCGNKLYVNYVL